MKDGKPGAHTIDAYMREGVEYECIMAVFTLSLRTRSTSGYVMTYAGGAVSWQSRLQKTVTLSTTETEYMAAVEAGKEILWMKDFIGELDIRQDEYRLYCDSQCHPPCEECGVPL